MSDEQPRQVGILRGLWAVVRGLLRLVGKVFGLFAGIARFAARRSRRKAKDSAPGSTDA